MDELKNIFSSPLQLLGEGPDDQGVTSLVRKKSNSHVFSTLSDFNIKCNVKPSETISKALSVLENGKLRFHRSNSKHNDWQDTKLNSFSDSLTVSTAPTSSVTSICTVDEESEMDTDQESEIPITSLAPDALFIVQGKEFPCHAQLLLNQARPLHEILSKDGVLERKSKKQRVSSSRKDQADGECHSQEWSSSSGITVVRLPNDVDADHFELLMEFLYKKEINLNMVECYQVDGEEDDPWLMDEEDILDDYDEENDDDQNDINLSALYSSQEDEATRITPLKFLQESFLFADHYGCHSLKTAIENKIYDEFLFSFTAKGLFEWADQNKCTYLKQKAEEKIPK